MTFHKHPRLQFHLQEGTCLVLVVDILQAQGLPTPVNFDVPKTSHLVCTTKTPQPVTMETTGGKRGRVTANWGWELRRRNVQAIEVNVCGFKNVPTHMPPSISLWREQNTLATHTPPAVLKGSTFSMSSLVLVIFCLVLFFYSNHPNGCEVACHCFLAVRFMYLLWSCVFVTC